MHPSSNSLRVARRLRRQHYLNAPAGGPALPAVPEPPPPENSAAPAHHGHHPHPHKHPAIAELEKTVETQREQLMRAQAEFENFRKRQRRDEQHRLEQANLGLIEQLLPVVDNFNRALVNPGDSVEGLLGGLQMIQGQLGETLRAAGVEKVEALGQSFDPNKHEAVCVEATAEVPDGQVVEVFQDGYMLKGRLVRPAMVKVARHP